MIGEKTSWVDDPYLRSILNRENFYKYRVESINIKNKLSESDIYQQRGMINDEKRQRQIRSSYSEMLWAKSPYRRRRECNQGVISTETCRQTRVERDSSTKRDVVVPE